MSSRTTADRERAAAASFTFECFWSAALADVVREVYTENQNEVLLKWFRGFGRPSNNTQYGIRELLDREIGDMKRHLSATAAASKIVIVKKTCK